MHLQYPSGNVSGLLDSGSSVNLMSNKLYDDLPYKSKSKLSLVSDDKIVLANNQEIHISDCTQIQATIQNIRHMIDVYAIQETSYLMCSI